MNDKELNAPLFCPFCKSKQVDIVFDRGDRWVECFNCGAHGPIGMSLLHGPDGSGVVKQWNDASLAVSSWEFVKQAVAETGFIDFGGRGRY